MKSGLNGDRVSPASEDAEQGILASILLDPPRAMDACVKSGLKPEHFNWKSNALIYSLLLEFWQENEPIELRIITQAMRDRGLLESCGGRVNGQQSTGAAYLTDLQILLPTACYIGNYLGTIKDKAIRRQIITECTGIAASAYDATTEDVELFGEAEKALLRIVKMQEGQKTHAREIKELVVRAADRIQLAIDGDGSITMPYGIKELDYETQGLRAPEMTVISAKSSDGKSALALNVTEELAVKRGKRVGIISLEMSDDQCADRLLSSMAWVDVRKIKRDRSITHDETQKLAGAAKRLASAPIFIRDDGQLTISEIGATFAAWKAKHGLDVGIIDHAQLVKGDGRTDGRTEEVEQISRALKPLAKRLEIALIVLSQVTEAKDGNYSTKNSKALQEDADNVLTISHKFKEGGEVESTIHISKQRDGERNKPIPVVWIPRLMRFTSKAKEPAQPELLPPAAKTRRT